jgi:3-oxoacyl-[acyl-carrier protein] reductase
MSFENKTVIVAGGARDIGRAITLAFAKAGAKVAFTFHGSDQAAAETLALAHAISPTCQAIKADLTDPLAAAGVVAAVTSQHGSGIDVLVHVTGGLVARRPLADMDADFFEGVMRLNVTSAFTLAKAVVPLMKPGSSIVTFASQAGRDGGGGGAIAYATAKGAIMSFTRGLAKELGPSGIRVNALCPGMISTAFHDTFTADEVRTKVAAGTPLRREGLADEVAAATLFLASDAAAFVTGTCLDINGGSYFS